MSDQTVEPNIEQKRVLSIDRFRGIIVFCMVFFQMQANFDSLGPLTRISSHDLSKGITILPGMNLADIVAPMFVFAMGLTYRQSFEKRKTLSGKKKAYLHFVNRYLALLGIGTILDYIDKWFSGSESVILPMSILVVLTLGLGVFYLLTNFKPISGAKKAARTLFWGAACLIAVVTLVFSVWDTYVVFTDQTDTLLVYRYWCVLQALGAAGLIALIFINVKPWKRLLATVILFAAYTLIHELPGNMGRIDEVVQGGLIGSLGWAAILMSGTVLADLFYKDMKTRKYYLAALPVIAVLAVAGYLFLRLNKGSVSPGYVLVNILISAVAFLICDYLNFLDKTKFKFAVWWGRNPILMYLLEYLLVDAVIALWGGADSAPVWVAVLYSAVIVCLFTAIAYLLYKKKRVVKL